MEQIADFGLAIILILLTFSLIKTLQLVGIALVIQFSWLVLALVFTFNAIVFAKNGILIGVACGLAAAVTYYLLAKRMEKTE